MIKVFNLQKILIAGRKPIKDRGISWQETYREKSKTLKKRFDEEIGYGSYYRWEGHDYTTNSDYYVVVGPTVQKSLGKCFFAGIKKLPWDWKLHKTKVYSPSGKYFTNIVSALSHASRKWNIQFPKNQTNYDKNILQPIKIPEHIRA